MATVGIIANPASGKDIRRLVALGLTVDNIEKVNVVKRIVLGLQSAGVDNVVCMPDYFNICGKAMDGLHSTLPYSIMEMRVRGTQDDSTEAARIMRDMGVGCIVTLGGDGTNRAVAKTCGDVPLVPISTGTNNVFPYMIEGTLAGLAAGVVARGIAPLERTTWRTKRLDIIRDGELIDIALIDIVVSEEEFIASRAIWDVSRVKAIILSRSEASNIGLSSVGGNLFCADKSSSQGVYLKVGKSPLQVTAPIAPGLINQVGISGYRLLSVGDFVEITDKPSILAVDGEREVEIEPEMDVKVRLSDRGPLVVDIGNALNEAAQENIFTQKTTGQSDGRVCLMLESRVCLAPCSIYQHKELEIK